MRVALFDVTISNCCSKGILGGIISFRDKQCIMNYNQNNSFVDNTLALGAQKNVKQLINAEDGKGDLIYLYFYIFILKCLVLVRQF